MAKTSTSKTNGHTVAALKPAAPRKTAARTAAVKSSPKAATAASKSVAPKAATKAVSKVAATPAAKPVKSVKAVENSVPAPAVKAAVVARKAPAPKAASAASGTKKIATPKPKPAPVKSTRGVTAARTPARAAEVDAAVNEVDDAARERSRKAKLVRDSFTMPEQEYAVLGQVKKACLKAGFDIKKSELLRIGVALISQLDMATLQKVLNSLPQLKTGRPKSI